MKSRGRQQKGKSSRKGQPERGRRKAIGIIAEDESDVRTLDVLIGKIAARPYLIKSFKGDGCGKIVGKCHAWSQNLHEQGCRYLLIVHDLDRARKNELFVRMRDALGASPIKTFALIIPVREIEAWLLADHAAIKKAMKIKGSLSSIANPEAIQNPKEFLGRLIYTKSNHSRRYVNAIDNVKIAAECVPNNLLRCSSFLDLHEFVANHI
jgi:hypothetical protein